MELKKHNIVGRDEFPLVALKNVVLFPRIIIPLVVQRPKSVAGLEEALAKDGYIVFVAQKNLKDQAEPSDFFRIGTVGRIVSTNRLTDGSFNINVEGITRVKIRDFTQNDPFFKAKIDPITPDYEETVENEALARNIIDQFKKVTESKIYPSVLPNFLFGLQQIKDPEQLVNLIVVNLDLELADQQDVLETTDLAKAMRKLSIFLTREIEIMEAEKKVVKETKRQLGKMQKEIFLREQLKSIEKELGLEDEKGEYDQLRTKIQKADMSKEVEAKALKELGRLEKMPMLSPEVSYLRTYLDWLVELPWSISTRKSIDLKQAEKVLNKDHAGLDKVKEIGRAH